MDEEADSDADADARGIDSAMGGVGLDPHGPDPITKPPAQESAELGDAPLDARKLGLELLGPLALALALDDLRLRLAEEPLVRELPLRAVDSLGKLLALLLGSDAPIPDAPIRRADPDAPIPG